MLSPLIVNHFKNQIHLSIMRLVEPLQILNLMVFLFVFFSLLIIVIVELDTLHLFLNGTEVPVTNRGISWSTDHNVKFQNPTNAADCKFSQERRKKS